ncbi:MAG: gamma-butyrobetaine hydroxylase-like domain-containing protein, partial [Pseudomonadota bacterium]|nr:gamma-butyrobetaine hydroxylase-like domain-containing protein [Pseudomonadota bacterium]
RYAVRLVFDDGHDTGLYSWDVFRELGEKHEPQWARYLQRLEEHGMTRDSTITKLSALPPGPKKWVPGTH